MLKYTQLEIPLLETIQQLGGRASTKEVYENLANKLNIPEEERKKRINEGSAHRKWDRMVRWVRQNLKGEGMIAGDNKGIWELTPKAKAFLKNAKPGIVITVYEVVDKKDNVMGLALWGDVSAACDR